MDAGGLDYVFLEQVPAGRDTGDQPRRFPNGCLLYVLFVR